MSADQRCTTELIIVIHLRIFSGHSTLAYIFIYYYYNYYNGHPKQPYQYFLNCIPADQMAVPIVQRKTQLIILIRTISEVFHTSKFTFYRFYTMFTMIKPNGSVFEFALCA